MKLLPADCVAVYEVMRQIGEPTTSAELGRLLPDVCVPAKLNRLRVDGIVIKARRGARHEWVWKLAEGYQ